MALKTYSWQEFHKKTGKDAAAYNRYLRYLANVRGKRLTKARDPFGGSDPYAGFEATPDKVGIAQATRLANQTFAPAIATEQADYQARQKQLRAGINEYSRGMAAFLQPQEQLGINSAKQAAAGIAASAGALGEAAKGDAGAAQTALSNLYTKIGASPAAMESAGQIGDLGQSIGSMLATRAQAAQEGTLSRGGNLGGYLAALPTISAIQGRKVLGSGLSQLSLKNLETLGGLRSKRAEARTGLISDFFTRELQKATGRATLGRSIYDANAGVINNANDNAAAGKRVISVQENADGSTTIYYADGTFSQGQPPGSVIPSGASATRAQTPGTPEYVKAKRAAIAQANTKVNAIIKAAVDKRVSVKRTVPIEGGITIPGVPTPTKTVTESVPAANYYRAINLAVDAAWPLLQGYFTRAQVIQMVQQRINKLYAPGKRGRPGTGKPPSKTAAGRAPGVGERNKGG